MTAAFKNEDLIQKLLNDTEKVPEFESVPGQCCIYRVPKRLRRVNEEVFTPQLISIGPLHHGKPELTDMEKKKKRYVKSFCQRTTTKQIDKILSFIKDEEKNIRACYSETSTLESSEFVLMILYDSIFIIEIFLREIFSKDRQRGTIDILLATVPLHHTLCTDLQLFENQLPYFVLKKIYRLASIPMDRPITFMELSRQFFEAFASVKLTTLTSALEREVKHFTDWRRITLLKGSKTPESAEERVEDLPCAVKLDWRRITLLKSNKKPKSAEKWVGDLPCAVKLHESGVKFKKRIGTEEEQSLLDIRFEKRKQLIPFFEVHELQIPQLSVNDGTERLLRNMIALEQCLYPGDSRICNYVQLMDYLINTEEDVDLLVGNGIISNQMGDNASVAKMFNKLNILYNESSYHYLCKQLKEHYENRWNNTKATLKRVYFNNLWRGTATVAAIILLLLTIIQTVCSILQVV